MTLLHSAQVLASAPNSYPLSISLLESGASDGPISLTTLPSIHPEEVSPCSTIQHTNPSVNADSMLLRIDPKAIPSCITSLDTLISTVLVLSEVYGLRRSHGLFEVDGNRRTDFYLFPGAGDGPEAHLYSTSM